MAKNGKKDNSFLVQGSILAAAGIIVRLIGLFYRVPLNNILGDHGAGIYSSAYNIYAVLLLLSSSSLPLAISKMIAERAAKKQYRNVRAVLRTSLVFSCFLGGATFCIIFFGADFFAGTVLNAPETAFALRLLAPTIFVMAFLSTMRGFFQGLGTMIPTAVSQIIEQIFNAVFSVACAYGLFRLGMTAANGGPDLAAAYGAGGGTIGTGVGALSALVVCIVIFFMFRGRFTNMVRRDRTEASERFGTLLKIVILTALPVTLSGTVTNISTVVDQSFFGHYMEFVSQSDQYMPVWGAYSSIYVLLTTLPIAISTAMAMSTAPSIAAANAKGDRAGMLSKIALSIRFCMIIAIPSTIGLTVLGGPVVKMLFPYNEGSAARMLLVGSVVVVFASLTTITSAILQGMGKVVIPVTHAAIALAAHFGFLAVALFAMKTGIYGVIFAIIFFNILTTILNLRYIMRALSYRQEIRKTFVIPAVCSVIMGAACFGVYHGCFRLVHRNIVSVAAAILAALIVYFVLLLKLKGIDELELLDAPMGARFVRIAKKIRLL
ncbi:MAG: polysaccharide biosynthesis protein [Lachnospiraceae bacterium]|nr:polysaccharide biosynthesis protein [Lachnospiraceae bacterium]